MRTTTESAQREHDLRSARSYRVEEEVVWVQPTLVEKALWWFLEHLCLHEDYLVSILCFPHILRFRLFYQCSFIIFKKEQMDSQVLFVRRALRAIAHSGAQTIRK
jgi:hypothetical protein